MTRGEFAIVLSALRIGPLDNNRFRHQIVRLIRELNSEGQWKFCAKLEELLDPPDEKDNDRLVRSADLAYIVGDDDR